MGQRLKCKYRRQIENIEGSDACARESFGHYLTTANVAAGTLPFRKGDAGRLCTKDRKKINYATKMRCGAKKNSETMENIMQAAQSEGRRKITKPSCINDA